MKRCKPRRNAPVNPTDVLATDIDARDNMRVGIQVVRNVRVTDRPSIRAKFTAPRNDMGEYSPVATHASEYEKMTGVDWSA